MRANDPSAYCKLWLRQNDAVEVEADQKAFDSLSPSMRAIVNDAPIQICCIHLLQGCRKLGEEVIASELRRELAEWIESFSP